jgi:hypothetical protein
MASDSKKPVNSCDIQYQVTDKWQNNSTLNLATNCWSMARYFNAGKILTKKSLMIDILQSLGNGYILNHYIQQIADLLLQFDQHWNEYVQRQVLTIVQINNKPPSSK